ncbi:MAG: hypothetical protein ACP5I7_07000 [Sulfolobales archaeon]
MSKTLKLIKVLERSEKPSPEDQEVLLRVAERNKVLLGFLRSADVNNDARILEENRYRRYVSNVAEVADALRGLNYAFHKFRKPVHHVSVDIDVLIDQRDLVRAVKKLISRGYRVKLLEKYTATLVKNSVIVDLYVHPAFAWVIYLDGSKLLNCCIEEFDFEGYLVRGLTKEAEAVVSAAHAIYKEHMYLLIDYFTTKNWLSPKALRLSSELGVEDSVKISWLLNKLVDEGIIELPHKISLALISKLYQSKFMRDPWFRATSPNLIKYLLSERAGEVLRWRLTRETY